MSGTLSIRNRQRTLPVDVGCLHHLARTLLRKLRRHDDFELGICLVRAKEMARLNQTFLGHEGPTDVITFDYSEGGSSAGPWRAEQGAIAGPPSPAVHGEIVVCADEVARQARRFGKLWQHELARYVIHGVLHLEGHDDTQPADRRRMRRKEDRLLKALDTRFALRKLSRKPRFAA